MRQLAKVSEEKLNEIAEICYEHLITSETKEQALTKIADSAADAMGAYFTPNILSYPDEISAHFIQIIDQVVFEMRRDLDDSPVVRDYIIDSLYQRASIYLDVFHDRNLFRRKLLHRPLTYDDTIIIRHFSMHEFIPYFITEFYDNVEMQTWILKALISFKNSEVNTFYTKIIGNDYPMGVKVLAYIGLKNTESEVLEIVPARENESEYKNIIEYCKNFNGNAYDKNPLPECAYTLLFTLNLLELNRNRETAKEETEWILSLFAILDRSKDLNTSIQYISTALANVILSLKDDQVECILNNQGNICSFINAIEFLPREHFERITIRLELMGETFTQKARELLNSGALIPDSSDSNIHTYILWNTPIQV